MSLAFICSGGGILWEAAMGLSKNLTVVLLSFGLAVGATSTADAKVTAKQIEKATTVSELMELGATKLTAAQFKQLVVGKPMADPKKGWSWIIEANGTTSSSAADGSWKEDAQPWSMKGDAYCTKIDKKTACRDVYMIGNYLRMSDKSDPAKLSNWTVTVDK